MYHTISANQMWKVLKCFNVNIAANSWHIHCQGAVENGLEI